MTKTRKDNGSSSAASSECGDEQASFTKLLVTALQNENVIKCLKNAITSELKQANTELKNLIIEKDKKIPSKHHTSGPIPVSYWLIKIIGATVLAFTCR